MIFKHRKDLCDQICTILYDRNICPQILIEPTCGEGNFIFAALRTFPSIQTIYAIELQPQYEWILKARLWQLSQVIPIQAKIIFNRDNIFAHDFTPLLNSIILESPEILILGNPPWITNSALELLQSLNIPQKKNLKQMKGMDALTGKSNFDLAESILLTLIQRFGQCNGHIAMLCKNIVVKNIIKEIPRLQLPLSDNWALSINAKRYFGANVSAVLFLSTFNSDFTPVCHASAFNSLFNGDSPLFGWFQDTFVANISKYVEQSELEGIFPFEWRQGVKHDLASVMVLQRSKYSIGSEYYNANDEIVDIEDTFLYPFVKSSDLKGGILPEVHRRVIIPQEYIGQSTDKISEEFLGYGLIWINIGLNLHIENLKYITVAPHFSIFGIGPYAFTPFKVAISGFYKQIHFTFLPSIENRPVMCDDTCYFLGFDNIDSAMITWLLLQRSEVQQFLESLIFPEEKRPITKDILMRINLSMLLDKIDFEQLYTTYESLTPTYGDFLTKYSYQFGKEDYNNYKLQLLN